MSTSRFRRPKALSPVSFWLSCGALLAGTGALAAGVTLRALPPDRSAGYTGSAACADCHREQHEEWKASLHTQMMRRPDQPGVIVADFESENPGRRFERADIAWVIGGKWEQQFMGHDGETETLLPGAWLGGAGEWDFQGWDGWQVPVPVRRCHGCHTVGLDVETGTWVEPNIGCESCHGPGERHVKTWGLARIHSSADAQVCGQCHTRGRSPDGSLFFPAGYRPGDRLSAFFSAEEPSPGQNSSSWWGTGHERQRHQEFTAWSAGGHANSLRSLLEGYDGRYGQLTEDCLRCHAGDYILSSRRARPSLHEAREGITCAVCHTVHGALDTRRVDCGDCHQGGAFYHDPERGADHVACPPGANVDCVGCHMPQITQVGGAFALHAHRPGVVTPQEAERFEMPSSCGNGGCHANRDRAWEREAYALHYADPGEFAQDLAHTPPQIAYLARGERYWQVWVMRPDGSGARAVTQSPSEKTRVSWYPDGRHLLVSTLEGRLWRVNVQTGSEEAIQTELRGMQDATLSPDGRRIAFSLSTASSVDDNEIWTIAADGSDPVKHTTLPWLQHDPEWSADGRAIYFLSGKGDDSHDIWRLDLESSSLEQITAGSLYHFEVAAAVDDRLAYSSNRAGHYDLWIQRPPDAAHPLTDDPPLDGAPSWSPDGSQLVFHSTRAGVLQIWRAEALDAEVPRLTQLTHHADGARDPVWRANSAGRN